MTTREVKVTRGHIEPCPKCGNTTVFVIHSEQVAEDCCEVWAQCVCGHEPHGDDRLEDVWGGCGDDLCQTALLYWNDSMQAARNPSTSQGGQP